MQVTTTDLILLVSADKHNWVSGFLQGGYDFHACSNINEAVKTLQNVRYDLLILDGTRRQEPMVGAVEEIKRCFPSLPIVLVTGSADSAYESHLMQAGVDGVLAKNLSRDELHYRLQFILNQYRQNRGLAQLSRNLHALASLSRLLYSISDPDTLLRQATRLLRNTFNLYGVAILLQEDNATFHLYADSEDATSRNRLYESTLRPNGDDPYMWSFRSRIVQLYKDIRLNENYAPAPVLRQAQAVAIIPLVHQNIAVGVMGIYAPQGDTLSNEDLVIYEQFGAQLISALQAASEYQAQAVNIKSSQYLLRAWQAFANLQTAGDIAHTLCELIEDLPDLGRAFVWLGADKTGAFREILVSTDDNQAVKIFARLREHSVVAKITRVLGDTLQPVLIDAETTPSGGLASVFRILEVSQIIVVPVMNSTDLIGFVVAGITDIDNFSIADINLVEHLCHTAGVTLERITLTSEIAEKSARLEAILHSISEGIFFVDDSSRVAFCNPQATELTSIPASNVLNQDAEVLLKAIAARTEDASGAYALLQSSRQAVTDSDNHGEDYPIIELALRDGERDIHIEFMKVDRLRNNRSSWAIVIRNAAQSERSSAFPDLLVSSMSENLRMPYAQLRSLVSILAEQHGHFNYRDRDLLVSQVKAGVEHVGHLWNNFLEVYDLEVKGVVLNRENANVQELIQRVLNGLSVNQRQVILDAPSSLPPVKVDQFRMSRALANVIQRALDISSEGSPISIRVEEQNREVTITIADAGGPLADGALEKLFEPVNDASNGFALYIARELVDRHGGRMWAEAINGKGTVIAMTLPALAGINKPNGVRSGATDAARITDETPLASRAPNRTPKVIMFVEGQSDLSGTMLGLLEETYEVLAFSSGEEALSYVNTTRLDLIVVDANTTDVDGSDLCRRMRIQTEAPIILLADKASDAQKVQGLHSGADDYITKPISDEELIARVRVIFNRQQIPARTSEPLEFGELYIDFARREVFLANKPVELTRIEYDLLYTLVVNKGQVLTHRQILEKVWGPDYQDETHYLWVNISRLRKKLESRQSSTRYIHTQSGTGYFFDIL
jgi:two-component system, OmpR family, KDP operon response regulator KdpE